MGLKVTVVGGASTYTPELVDGIVARADRMPVDELVLLDPAAERLTVVGGLAGRMLARAGWAGRLTLTGDQRAAVEGADFVLVQLRVGGQAARLTDETIPLRYGTIGQETTGAGGFAKALRTIPVVLGLAEDVRAHAAPGAWIVDFTNPVGMVTQALIDDGHRAIGLCNVAIGLQRQVAARLGVTPDRVELEHVGLNHLSWERGVRVDGVDRLPGWLASDADMLAETVGMPAELIRALASIPSYYLRYYYRFADVLAGQLAGGHIRAQEVAELEQRLLTLYRDPTLDTKPELLDGRGGAFYSEVAAQLMASLHDGRGDVQVVDVRNDGCLPDLPPDAVVEVPARIDREGAHPLALGPLDPDVGGLVHAVLGFQTLTIRAARTGDRTTALRALLANPLIHGLDMAQPLLAELLEVNRPLLPRFASA